MLEGALLKQSSYLKSKIEQLISEQIEMLKDNLSQGSPQDYASYLRVVGKIEGLRSALDLCDEAERIVERDT
jgi:mRNA-degrading endonuclease RelE of RelBE toxin-antitoxin system